jgi:hypothetical protein
VVPNIRLGSRTRINIGPILAVSSLAVLVRRKYSTKSIKHRSLRAGPPAGVGSNIREAVINHLTHLKPSCPGGRSLGSFHTYPFDVPKLVAAARSAPMCLLVRTCILGRYRRVVRLYHRPVRAPQVGSGQLAIARSRRARTELRSAPTAESSQCSLRSPSYCRCHQME